MSQPQVANLSTLLAQSAALFPHRPGLIQGEQVWTWSAINARVDALVQGAAIAGRQGRRQDSGAVAQQRAAVRKLLGRVPPRSGLGADQLQTDAAGSRLSRRFQRGCGHAGRGLFRRTRGCGEVGIVEPAPRHHDRPATRRRDRLREAGGREHRRADGHGRGEFGHAALVLLHLGNDRAAEGGDADPWADGLRRDQPPCRPHSGHRRERLLHCGGTAVARRRNPRAAQRRSRRADRAAALGQARAAGLLATRREAPRDQSFSRCRRSSRCWSRIRRSIGSTTAHCAM